LEYRTVPELRVTNVGAERVLLLLDGEELRFRAITYQKLIAAFGESRDAAEAAYLAYLRERYIGDARA
jgi:hypothetical protein